MITTFAMAMCVIISAQKLNCVENLNQFSFEYDIEACDDYFNMSSANVSSVASTDAAGAVDGGSDHTVVSVLDCVRRCPHSNCQMAVTYSRLNDGLLGCKLFESEDPSLSTVEMELLVSADVCTVHRPTSRGMPNEWTLAFRSAKQSGLSVWDTWMNTGHHDDDPAISDTVPFGCLTTDSSLFCDRIYRSHLLDNWKGVKEAQVALFKDKQKVFFVTFNSTGVTDKNNFMSIDRVIDSSVPELCGNKVTPLFFNVRGDPIWCRRFFLQKSYSECGIDRGWMVAVDLHDKGHIQSCPWERYPKYPMFLYTKSTSHIRWQNSRVNVGQADVLAVYLKV